MYSTDDDEGGNPMVAGFQDEIDSEDEVIPVRASSTAAVKNPAVTADIDLTSDEEDAKHSTVQVTYDVEYLSSDDEADADKQNNVNSDKTQTILDNVKSKANSFSSNSDKDLPIKTKSGSMTDSLTAPFDKGRSSSFSSQAGSEADGSQADYTDGSLSTKANSSVHRKISSDSSRSNVTSELDGSRHVGRDSANQESDSDSDGDTGQIRVLQDADVNPDDFGGEDVFNAWLNKQEEMTTQAKKSPAGDNEETKKTKAKKSQKNVDTNDVEEKEPTKKKKKKKKQKDEDISEKKPKKKEKSRAEKDGKEKEAVKKEKKKKKKIVEEDEEGMDDLEKFLADEKSGGGGYESL